MSSSSQVAESWITSFCNLLGHEYFAEVSEDFIEDDFNLTGLQSQVPMYKEALEMILDVEPEEDEDDEDEEDDDDDDDEILGDEKPVGYRRSERRHLRMASDLSVIESSAELLYGLIHQRYITSRPGIQQMAEKYELQHFGVCPRVHCNGAKVLPVGCSDTPGQETVKLFCPSCLDVYTPPNSRFQTVDGAFFGTTFGCLFFMTFPELEIGAPRMDRQRDDHHLIADSSSQTSNSKSRTASSSSVAVGALPPQPTTINGVAPSNLAPGLGDGSIYEPRIYGFRVSERSRSGPRMKWLRMRPADVNELDEARIFHERRREMVEDIDEEDEEGEDSTMMDANAAAAEGVPVVPRKKAVARRRRTANGSVVTAGGRGSPMDTNGVGEGG
ncbi:Casein kinase ii beta subunit [Neofusicoccum parvum]|uniref:Casein kinase II subunit beta n=2 Tax=Neofusicoccum parvum TaxID=310453 RepID=R1GHU0_BOTPV|nr:putative casein kinase ii beta subunit ckb1 protein [Neofusicoccum parvum UCRNP2]GME22981.1 Casein kinase ii beta subunit [Neofusicoccum parvum]GME50687.1 Casein kinase ii beta subunit [Neofusicoccum parvum]